MYQMETFQDMQNAKLWKQDSSDNVLEIYARLY